MFYGNTIIELCYVFCCLRILFIIIISKMKPTFALCLCINKARNLITKAGAAMARKHTNKQLEATINWCKEFSRIDKQH